MSFPHLWKRVYRIGGTPALAVHSDSRAALNALELRHAGEAEAPGMRLPLEIFLLGSGSAGAVPAVPPEAAETVFAGDAVSILSGEGLHFGNWYGRASNVSDPRTGRAVITVPGLRRYHPDFISRHIFRPVLDRLLFDRGWLPLHAAACADGERGLLLLGDSGSGKTTLLLRLLEEGSGFLADDRALVRGEGGRFLLHAFPERVRRVVAARGRKRSLIASGAALSTAEAQLILFLEPDRDGEPRMDRIGSAEAAARLSHSVSPWMKAREREALLPVIGDLCRGAACRVLRGWGDPEKRALLVERLLREGGTR